VPGAVEAPAAGPVPEIGEGASDGPGTDGPGTDGPGTDGVPDAT